MSGPECHNRVAAVTATYKKQCFLLRLLNPIDCDKVSKFIAVAPKHFINMN